MGWGANPAPPCYRGTMVRPRYAKGEEVELVPDAWERFERALKGAVRAPVSAPAKKAKAKRRKGRKAKPRAT